MGDTWGPGVALILVVFIIILVPCLGISVLGYNLLERLAHFPSKTPAIQKSILVKLLIIELISIALLLTFFHALSDYR